MKKKLIMTFGLLIAIGVLSSGYKKLEGSSDNRLGKVTTNDLYSYIAINQILMYVSNNGDGSHDPVTDGSGFYWPGGERATKTAIFQDGLIWGGKIGRETRVNGSVYRQGLQAGKILESGEADDPSDPKYRVYKIRKNWEKMIEGPEKDALRKDYEEWPFDDGAPFVYDEDGNKVPHFIGDEVLWFVSNDLDEARATFTYGTAPIGLEVQTTVFGFDRVGDFSDIVFKKYLVINKGQNTYKDVVFGYWSDTDLGNAGDDLTGCDTVLSLGYTYNGDDDDGTYESPVPAVGYDFFQGPIVESPGDTAKFLGKPKPGFKNLGLTAFTLYINSSAIYTDPRQGEAQGSIEFYNYLTGLIWNGIPFIDPQTGEPVNFTVPGDPVAGTGWYEVGGWPGGPLPDDRRHLMASGTERDTETGELINSLTLAPGDSQEIVVGFIIARGSNTLDSVTELKRKDASAQIAFDLNFQLTPSPPQPISYGVPRNKDITLYWEDNAENYDEYDKLLTKSGFEDTTYNFEGYRIFQYSDETGSDETLIGLFDLENGIFEIYESQKINGINTRVPVINSNDEGLQRSLTVTKDFITGEALRNGTPYYFSVTAYGYSPNSIPEMLESSPNIITVIPGTQKIDVTYTMDQDDNLRGVQASGDGHGYLFVKIADPDILTGEEYRATVYGSEEDSTLMWMFENLDTGDTLDEGNYVFNRDSTTGKYFDGFVTVLQNEGRDSLEAIAGKVFGVKSVEEVANASGPLDTPVDLIKGTNSTGTYSVTAYGADVQDVKQNINDVKTDAIGYDNYEIRFTEEGSEYYLYGYFASFRGPTTRDAKAPNDRVPFEVWNIGRDLESTDDDVRLNIKIQDTEVGEVDTTRYVPDSTWTRTSVGTWEPIYAWVEPDSTYIEGGPDKLKSQKKEWFPLTSLVIDGELPETGTVIRITPWRPIQEGDSWTIKVEQANKNNLSVAKNNLDKISVFPNPYFGANSLERDKYQRFVRFTNLPTKAKIRIFSIAGILVNTLEKDDESQWLDWNLLNVDLLPVASGVYIAHLDLPGVGSKIMKIAVIQEKQYIDRL